MKQRDVERGDVQSFDSEHAESSFVSADNAKSRTQAADKSGKFYQKLSRNQRTSVCQKNVDDSEEANIKCFTPEEQKRTEQPENVKTFENNENDCPEAPDGGWGWMVVLGGSIMQLTLLCSLTSYGVLFAELVENRGVLSTEAAWISALFTCTWYLSAPVSSALTYWYPHRVMCLTGVFISSSGLVLSFFVTEIQSLYVTYGVLSGLGAGIGLPPSLLLLHKYFNKKRATANSLLAVGGSLGQIVLPVLLQYLFTQYGYKGALLIQAGIVLNGCVGAVMFRPLLSCVKRNCVTKWQRPSAESEVKNTGSLRGEGQRNWKDTRYEPRNKNLILELEELVPPTSVISFRNRMSQQTLQDKTVQNEGNEDEETSFLSETENAVDETGGNSQDSALKPGYDTTTHVTVKGHGIRNPTGDNIPPSKQAPRGKTQSPTKFHCFDALHAVNFSFLKNPVLYISCISSGFSRLSYIAFLMILPAYGVSLGLTESDAAFLVSVIAISDTCCRAVIGRIVDHCSLPARYFFMGGSFVITTASLVISFAQTYEILVLCCVMFGLGAGSMVSLALVLLAEYLGPENLPRTYASALICSAFINLAGTLIVGTIKDASGSFRTCFRFLTCTCSVPCLVWSLEPAASRYHRLAGSRSK